MDDGDILLAPTASGYITKIDLDGSKILRISKGNFSACSKGIYLETKAKIKGILGSGERIFRLRAKGRGILFVNHCGSIYNIKLEEVQEYIVDSTHLVLWDDEME